jgi:hypothetical protein
VKKSYPTWLVPRTHTVGLDYKTVRSRLGAQVANAKLTEEQMRKRSQALHAAMMEKTTPEQRSEWAQKAALVAAAILKERYTQEERRAISSAGGKKSQAMRKSYSTAEQRSEWSRKGGLAAQKKRREKAAAGAV